MDSILGKAFMLTSYGTEKALNLFGEGYHSLKADPKRIMLLALKAGIVGFVGGAIISGSVPTAAIVGLGTGLAMLALIGLNRITRIPFPPLG